MRVGATVHALPAPDATVTKCGVPLRQAGSNAGFAGERTKARVTCPECKRIGSADFARGWDDAIARGVTGEDEDAE